MGRRLGWTILAVVLGGCGGAGATATDDRCPAGARAEEMRVQLRRDRHAIRDLENEVALLRAKLRDRPEPSPGPDGRGRAPDPALAAGARGVAGEGRVTGEPQPESFGGSIYGGDVEIVYEGEAARPSKPLRIELHETSRSSQGLVPGDGDAAENAQAPPVRRDLGSERLPVTSGKIPTVAEQLRRAPAATIPAAGGGARVAATPPGGHTPAPAPAPSAAPAGRAAATGGAVVPSAVKSPPGPPLVEAPAAAPTLTVQSDPMAEYQLYMAALRRGNHEYAVTGLRALLDRFPRHYVADNVQYFVAESYYQRKLHSVALAEFKKVVERHWRSDKLPDAMFKIGLCHLALGHHEAGRAALRRLVVRFPRTEPGKRAKARLQELKRR